MQTFRHAAVDSRPKQSPWDQFFGLLAGGFCPSCRTPNAHQSLSQDINQWHVVVACERCRWSLGGCVQADDVVIGEGLARAKESHLIDQDLLACWHKAQQELDLLERRKRALIRALIANTPQMDGLLSVRALPQRGKRIDWALVTAILGPDASTALRERWQPKIDQTAVVAHLTRPAANVNSFTDENAQFGAASVIMQSAMFEFLVLREGSVFPTAPEPTSMPLEKWCANRTREAFCGGSAMRIAASIWTEVDQARRGGSRSRDSHCRPDGGAISCFPHGSRSGNPKTPSLLDRVAGRHSEDLRWCLDEPVEFRRSCGRAARSRNIE